jgi:hypothetical protein
MTENRSDEDQKAIDEFLKNGGKIKKLKAYERSEPLEGKGANFYKYKKKETKSED